MPSRAVKATEVVESIQQVSVGIDAIAKKIEKAVKEVIRMLSLTILQFIGTNDLLDNELVTIIGKDAALKLMTLAPAERYTAFLDDLKTLAKKEGKWL